MKNEHIVWAYGERADGKGQVLIIGLTNEGLAFLQAGEGKDKKTLTITPPGTGFANVADVILFNEQDKATLKQRLRETGLIVSEIH